MFRKGVDGSTGHRRGIAAGEQGIYGEQAGTTGVARLRWGGRLALHGVSAIYPRLPPVRNTGLVGRSGKLTRSINAMQVFRSPRCITFRRQPFRVCFVPPLLDRLSGRTGKAVRHQDRPGSPAPGLQSLSVVDVGGPVQGLAVMNEQGCCRCVGSFQPAFGSNEDPVATRGLFCFAFRVGSVMVGCL